MKRKILITGGTGMIGRKIIDKLCREGAYIKLLTRDTDKAKTIFEKNYTVETLKMSVYDHPLTLRAAMEDSDVVINLAGENVSNKRWNKKFKEELYNSRIQTTKLLVDTILICKNRPKILISASGVGVYGFRGDEVIDEDGSPGNDFLARLCTDWENEAMKAVEYDLRVVIVRAGIVLDKNDGALKELMKPYKYMIGGKIGSGKQWFSWIHIDDIVNMYLYAIENDKLFGPVNGTSPNPVTNEMFSKILGRVLRRPSLIPVPSFALKIAVGKFANNLLTGQRVIPIKAVKAGFEFQYPQLKTALEDLLKK